MEVLLLQTKNKLIMNNTYLLCGLIVIILFTSCTPDATEVLQKSAKKCQTIENGYYELDKYMKFMSGKDTTLMTFNCYFDKITNDSLFPVAFHYQSYITDEYFRDVLYTGDDFVYTSKDSTGSIMSKSIWADEIEAIRHNFTLYTPFTSKRHYPFPADSAYFDNNHSFQLVGEENINDFSCYHIKMNVVPENEVGDVYKTIREEIHFWINKEDNIPVQYTIAYDLVTGTDTMYQFEKIALTEYKLNNLKDKSHLEVTSIPSYITIETYVPHESPELLANETLAPNWTLISLENKTLSLSDFKGEFVLLDFFYKSCYPCKLALPTLQKLHEKYHKRGLNVVGIDPYDTIEEDDIANFLSKRGVTYTVLLGGKDVATKYNVSGYPTIYLIDKEGKIIGSKVGYGENTEEELEEMIKQSL